jgi:hypothetical protein
MLRKSLCAVLTSLAAAPAHAEPASFSADLGAKVDAMRTSRFDVDRHGLRSPDDPQLGARVRMRLGGQTGEKLGGLRLSARVAADAVDGVYSGEPGLPAGDKLPGDRFEEGVLREAWLEAAWGRLLMLRAGLQQSHWGLGIVANDGDDLFGERREAWFTEGGRGDRVLRTRLSTMPFARSESALRGWLLAFALDRVVEDDVADFDAGEEAVQGVVASRFYLAKDRWVGLYYVHREQDHDDGKSLTADVFDAALDLSFSDQGLRVQVEGAYVTGRTTLFPSPDHPEHDLVRGALAGRLRWEAGITGLRVEIDGGWFSGDENMDDVELTAFRADRSYQQGLLLFRRVLAWQTGMARANASDPLFSGRPAEDLQRVASDGAVYSAVTVYPKVGYRISEAVEVYAGALFAWAADDLVDPFNTRTAGGGYARNFVDAKADGSYLGTELGAGLGLRLPVPGLGGSKLHAVIEYAVLQPGGALVGDPAGAEPVSGARLALALILGAEGGAP